MQSIRKVNILFSLILILSYYISSQDIQKIDFYGVISSNADKNMIKMTEDLFYTQLKDFNITLNDYRNDIKSKNITSEKNLIFPSSTSDSTVFYVIIERNGDALSKWNCKLCIKKVSDLVPTTFIKEYDSYYKILMESKDSLKSALSSILIKQKTNQVKEKTLTDSQNPIYDTKVKTNENQKNYVSIDTIVGTWIGEESIVKIVIMKGGRGFIIFKDGAAMNIVITITSQEDKQSSNYIINIKQTGHSNTSYFPELTKKDAIEAAKIANPIEWNFNTITETMLTGKKKTLQIDKETNSFIEEYIDVSWTKKNN